MEKLAGGSMSRLKPVFDEWLEILVMDNVV